MALENCGLTPDAIVDEHASPYPPGGNFEIQELTTEGYAPLLRIERGRVRQREIFGPARLHYGIFKLQSRGSRYRIAREDGRIVGAVGFTLDPVDKAVRVFELIALHDEVVRFLLRDLERACRDQWECLIEVDVSAHAPRMQRTLLELGFLPVGYLPGLVFHEVERLDVVKMLRLLNPPLPRGPRLTPKCEAFADLVLRLFRTRTVLPKIADAVHHLSLFAGLTDEQVARLAGMCTLATFQPGETILQEGQAAKQMYVLLKGETTVARSATPVGMVRSGECLGEVSFLTGGNHSATAKAVTQVEAAVLDRPDLLELIRLRPDIGLHIYRNLAVGTGEKLKRRDGSSGPMEG
jgi:hypothetical protein